MVWVNDGDRIIKLNWTHVLPQPSDSYQSQISELLKRLAPFESHIPPNVFITEVIKPNEPRGSSGEFDQAIADKSVGLL